MSTARLVIGFDAEIRGLVMGLDTFWSLALGHNHTNTNFSVQGRVVTFTANEDALRKMAVIVSLTKEIFDEAQTAYPDNTVLRRRHIYARLGGYGVRSMAFTPHMEQSILPHLKEVELDLT